MDGEEAINETAKGKTVTTTTSTTIAAVHGTGPAAPRMRAMICSVGSTISGHVTASADNVHPRAAAGHQRRTFIRRSSRMSNGCTKKNAPHTTDIPQRPSTADASNKCQMPLTMNAANNARTRPCRANGP